MAMYVTPQRRNARQRCRLCSSVLCNPHCNVRNTVTDECFNVCVDCSDSIANAVAIAYDWADNEQVRLALADFTIVELKEELNNG